MINSLFRVLFPVFLLFLFSLPAIEQDVTSKTNASTCEPSSQKQVWLRVESQDDYRFVENLRLEDLAVTTDKLPAEAFRLELKQDQSLAVVILLDTSTSQQYSLPQTKLAGQKFVEWILKTKKDRAALVSFSGTATVEEDLTNDLPKIRTAIGRIHTDRPADYGVAGRTPPITPQRQGTSAIWDAVWATTEGILQSAGDSRRVIVLLTDGEDSSSSTTLRQTIEYAAGQDVAVFSIGITDTGYFRFGRNDLTDLSTDTGGRAFFPKKIQDLPDILQKIEQEVRATYLLNYCPAKSLSSSGKLQIEITNPQLRKAKVRLLYRRYVL